MNIEEKLYERIWQSEGNGRAKIDKDSRVDVALKLIEKGDRILDIGCGDGTLGYFAKNNYREVYGVDISDNALEIAKKRGVITKKVNLNDENLPFKDNYFDAITCLDVIEHVFEPIVLIKEIYRVLIEGGLVVISTPNVRYWHHLFDLVIKGKFPKTSNNTEHYDGGHLHYFTYKDIETLLKINNFKIVMKAGVFGKETLKEFLSTGIVIKAKR
ncbi:MAG: class I SAM-dependent methyltransferase [Methanocellales archaeon]|nr:class I SAM-dependent methyltransferase [Methanocellales archaeon]MDD3291869.1 class I SAM-dependent methyltransferase [Methanocellales archaeon]MDD5235512.1 class I SAM-dependent methyltransferase [Methanocellales archaeon]MDD5485131.1 class I SAM-dependent methyltransferase [Methanocellales archaeon]